ncbi:MAG TPA: hypothetical protein VFB20_17240 [Burkholderiales bacterium]|nr:hypothetical protein [Burkholderiales bacterium]
MDKALFVRIARALVFVWPLAWTANAIAADCGVVATLDGHATSTHEAHSASGPHPPGHTPHLAGKHALHDSVDDDSHDDDGSGCCCDSIQPANAAANPLLIAPDHRADAQYYFLAMPASAGAPVLRSATFRSPDRPPPSHPSVPLFLLYGRLIN